MRYSQKENQKISLGIVFHLLFLFIYKAVACKSVTALSCLKVHFLQGVSRTSDMKRKSMFYWLHIIRKEK